MSARRARARRQRGFVLIASLLLLLIITILAVSMFRSFGIQEKIAGNIREKQRATHAAEEAQQYAEWWLTSSNNAAIPAVACTTQLNANLNEGQICSNTLASSGLTAAGVPWDIGGNAVGVSYTPPGMSVEANAAAGTYVQAPIFYIAYLGTCSDGVGSCYQIDAVGYGGTGTAVSVVESTYEISAGVVNRGGL